MNTLANRYTLQYQGFLPSTSLLFELRLGRSHRVLNEKMLSLIMIVMIIILFKLQTAPTFQASDQGGIDHQRQYISDK
jgi:hypothetical protein